MEIRKLELGEGYENYYVPLHNVFIWHSPFSNCQVFTIGGVNNLIANLVTKDKILEAFKQIVKLVDKSRMVIDVEDYYASTIDTIFENNIIFKQPYISSNESDMIMYQINVEDLY